METETEQLLERIMSLLRQAESLLSELKEILTHTTKTKETPSPPLKRDDSGVRVDREKFESLPAEEDPFDSLLKVLQDVLDEAEKALLASDDLAPLQKVLSHSRMVKEEGEKGEFAYAVSVFLVRLMYKCYGASFSALRQKGEKAVNIASRIANNTLDVEIVAQSDGDESELAEYVERVSVYSKEPKGRVVALAEASVLKNDKVVQKGRVLVSIGEQHPVSEFCEKALETVAALRPEDEQSRKIRSKLLEELRKRQSLLFPIKPEHITAQLRSILNPLDSALFYGNFSNGELLKSTADSLADELRKHGWRQIVVPLGTSFDDSFSPSKFERRFVESDKPTGTIVGVIRRGFVDKTGVATQKTLLAISK